MVRVRPAAAGDVPQVRGLLERSGLPLDGVEGLWRSWVAVDDAAGPHAAGRVLGCVGVERHGDAYLLRSLAVEPDGRGRGLGAALVAAALAAVPAARDVALLTETAAAWFPRFGFRPVDRGDLDPDLAGSVELTTACPATARALVRPAGAAPAPAGSSASAVGSR